MPNYQNPKHQYSPSNRYSRTGNPDIELIEKQIYIGPIIALLLFCIAIGAVIFLIFFKKDPSTTINIPTLGGNTTVVPTQIANNSQESLWCDKNSKYYIRLNIMNNSSLDVINQDEELSVYFNHSLLVSENKSLIDAKDMQMYTISDNTCLPLATSIENPNTEQALLKFITPIALQPRQLNTEYYLYYGSGTPTSNIYSPGKATGVSYTINLDTEVSNAINIALSRTWVIRGGNSIDPSYKDSIVELTSSDINQLSSATLNVYDYTGKKLKTIGMVKQDNTYFQRIEALNLPIGEYLVQATATVGGTQQNSTKLKVYISYPLYVNWSIDWEGDGVDDQALAQIEEVSTEYSVPITHYFNPRIYAGGMSSERSQYVTNWVLQRKSKGDEIGLHLHMWYDMVRAAGLNPRSEPNWNYGATGHDVLGTAYPADEFDQLIKWALTQFEVNGLPKPLVYRAGGWHINGDQLKVLVNNGFIADSSARDADTFGAKSYPLPWNNIYAGSRPYRPSETDINQSGDPEIGLWEFPNNASNTSNYGAYATKVLDNFKLNFNGNVMKERQTFVILSHVQYFNKVDYPIIKNFFQETSKFLAKNDAGPVIYVTLEQNIPDYNTVSSSN